MTDLPCPKCGAKMESVGAKMVCSECYHVADPGAAAAAPPAAPKPPKDPNAPLPTFTQAPPAALAPGVCPKCNGQTSDVGGRLVCGQCYWVVDQGKTPVPTASTSTQAAPPAFSMAHFGIIVTIIFAVILVFMVQSLNKMPPPTFGGQPRNPGTAPATPGAPTSPAPAMPSSPQGVPPQTNPSPMPPTLVPQGGLTSPQNTQPQLPPQIVPQGGISK